MVCDQHIHRNHANAARYLCVYAAGTASLHAIDVRRSLDGAPLMLTASAWRAMRGSIAAGSPSLTASHAGTLSG